MGELSSQTGIRVWDSSRFEALEDLPMKAGLVQARDGTVRFFPGFIGRDVVVKSPCGHVGRFDREDVVMAFKKLRPLRRLNTDLLLPGGVHEGCACVHVQKREHIDALLDIIRIMKCVAHVAPEKLLCEGFHARYHDIATVADHFGTDVLDDLKKALFDAVVLGFDPGELRIELVDPGECQGDDIFTVFFYDGQESTANGSGINAALRDEIRRMWDVAHGKASASSTLGSLDCTHFDWLVSVAEKASEVYSTGNDMRFIDHYASEEFFLLDNTELKSHVLGGRRLVMDVWPVAMVHAANLLLENRRLPQDAAPIVARIINGEEEVGRDAQYAGFFLDVMYELMHMAATSHGSLHLTEDVYTFLVDVRANLVEKDVFARAFKMIIENTTGATVIPEIPEGTLNYLQTLYTTMMLQSNLEQHPENVVSEILNATPLLWSTPDPAYLQSIKPAFPVQRIRVEQLQVKRRRLE